MTGSEQGLLTGGWRCAAISAEDRDGEETAVVDELGIEALEDWIKGALHPRHQQRR
jgi:hypothetical protein